MIANSAVYRQGKQLTVDVPPDDLQALRDAVKAGEPGDFVSVELHEPDEAEMQRVAEVFGLHPLAVEDSLHPVQRPKLEKYPDMVFLVLRTLWTGKQIEGIDGIEGGQVALFMGPDYVLTVRQGASFELESVRVRLEQSPAILGQGPPAVVYAVCDRVVDVYEQLATALSSDVDDVEDAVFAGTKAHVSRRINELNGDLTIMRRAIHPLQGPMQQFAGAEIPGVSPEAALYFRDVADHVTRVGEEVDALGSQLSGAFDSNLSRIGVQQNDDMRRMSAWAAIAAVITVLAGIYGMNFAHMPELTWSFGYPGAILLMVVLCSWLYRRFKKSGWL